MKQQLIYAHIIRKALNKLSIWSDISNKLKTTYKDPYSYCQGLLDLSSHTIANCSFLYPLHPRNAYEVVTALTWGFPIAMPSGTII